MFGEGGTCFIGGFPYAPSASADADERTCFSLELILAEFTQVQILRGCDTRRCSSYGPAAEAFRLRLVALERPCGWGVVCVGGICDYIGDGRLGELGSSVLLLLDSNGYINNNIINRGGI